MQSGYFGPAPRELLEVLVTRKRAGSSDLEMGLVETAVKRDLEALAKRQKGLDESAEAATAIALARELDLPNSATSKSMCARALTETMVALRAMAPPERSADGLDEIAKARQKRVAAR